MPRQAWLEWCELRGGQRVGHGVIMLDVSDLAKSMLKKAWSVWLPLILPVRKTKLGRRKWHAQG